MEKIKIVKIMGGLGNQMFQYAFSKAIEKKFDCKVLYDLSFFEKDRRLNTINNCIMRTYELDLFNIDVPVADKELIRKCAKNKIAETNLFSFDESLMNPDKDYFEGYFQNENYFSDISDDIKNYFKFPEIDEDDEFNHELLNKIKEENAVFIHIRRGDYLNSDGSDNVNTLQADFYKKAVRYIESKVKNPVFYIFGEDCEDYIKTKLKFIKNYCYIGNHNSKESWKDIVLMMSCKHGILANSTFSWWAGWLSDYKDKIIIAPSPWLNRSDDIVCKSWVKIKRKKYKQKKLKPCPLLTFINNIRYLFKYNLKEINKKTESIDSVVNQAVIKSQKFKIPTVKDNFETLEELVNTNKSIIRFGDGEFAVMDGKSIPFQNFNADLSMSLREIFYKDEENLLIGAPFEYFEFYNPNYNETIRRHLSKFVPENFDKICGFFNTNKTYYSTVISQVTPIYRNYDFEKHFSLFRKIWEGKNVTLITGDRVLNNIRHNILDNANKIENILGPTKNAYDEYEILLDEIIKKAPKDNILLFAIGPAGKVLGYELFKMGYRVIDIGHAIKDYDSYKSNIKMDKNGIIKFFSPD